MAIGMTYEEYWFGDPMMVRAYYKADQLRRERIDEDAWINGLYVLSALEATVGNAFREKGQRPVEYPKEPYTLSKKRQEEKERTEREKEQEAVWAKAWMQSFVDAGRKFGRNKQQEG